MYLTRRGERLIGALLSIVVFTAMIALFGFAGWVEGLS